MGVSCSSAAEVRADLRRRPVVPVEHTRRRGLAERLPRENVDGQGSETQRPRAEEGQAEQAEGRCRALAVPRGAWQTGGARARGQEVGAIARRPNGRTSGERQTADPTFPSFSAHAPEAAAARKSAGLDERLSRAACPLLVEAPRPLPGAPPRRRRCSREAPARRRRTRPCWNSSPCAPAPT